MFRALFAGDAGRFSWAGHLGCHTRKLDEAAIPGSPRGSELQFGLAGGYRIGLGRAGELMLGPELFGATTARGVFGATTTGVEGLMTGRWEQAGEGSRLRVKLAAGGGLHAEFGAPAWRAIVGIELLQRGR
jgi:hypothetical protein